MRIGILGAGQLGRMLALAGYPLGLQFTFFDPAEEPCACQVGPCLKSAYDDEKKLRELAAQVDLVTFEFENVPVEAVRFLEKIIPVRPGLRALEVTQDRLREKNLFQELEIPVPPYRAVDSAEALAGAVKEIGLPLVLKTRRFGYDGKGQMVLRDLADLPAAWESMQKKPLIAEKLVDFQREVSLLAVRGLSGETAFYPLAENVHQQGILRRSACRNNDPLQGQAETYAGRILDALDYTGLLAVEFFQVDGDLLANEVAPRVHNSGHWTIEGAATSQFENHLRAITGWPLGKTSVTQQVGMLNIIGKLPDTESVLRIPDTHLHIYGKKPVAFRKVGHITILRDQQEGMSETMDRVDRLLHPFPA